MRSSDKALNLVHLAKKKQTNKPKKKTTNKKTTTTNKNKTKQKNGFGSQKATGGFKGKGW